MTAYLIVDVDVRDAEAYAEYVRQAPPLVARHGGEYLVRGGAHEALEGAWRPARLVVIAFPSAHAARAFLDDPDYAPVKAIRHRVAASNVTLVEGAPASPAPDGDGEVAGGRATAHQDPPILGSRPRALTGLRHVALCVRHFEATERFYAELLGMCVEWRPDADNCYLTSGNDNLALHRASGEPAPAGQRLDHIGFIAARPADVDGWHTFLAAAGVPIVAAPKTHRDGARSFYCQDPEGTTVQIIHHPPLGDV